MQILKAGIHLMDDSVLFACLPEKLHQLAVSVAVQLVGIAVLMMVSLPHAGKMLVQRLIEIFPVAFPQGHPHAEADNPLHLGLNTGFQDPFYVFSGIIDKRKNR